MDKRKPLNKLNLSIDFNCCCVALLQFISINFSCKPSKFAQIRQTLVSFSRNSMISIYCHLTIMLADVLPLSFLDGTSKRRQQQNFIVWCWLKSNRTGQDALWPVNLLTIKFMSVLFFVLPPGHFDHSLNSLGHNDMCVL